MLLGMKKVSFGMSGIKFIIFYLKKLIEFVIYWSNNQWIFKGGIILAGWMRKFILQRPPGKEYEY